VFFAELSGVEPPLSTAGVTPELPNRSQFVLVGTTAADLAGAVGANSNRPERLHTTDAATILPTATGGDDRRSWMGWMNGSIWERLVRFPRRRLDDGLYGHPHGWGPRGVSAAYRRRFGASPPKNHRGHYVYSRTEIEAGLPSKTSPAAGEVVP